MVTITPSTRHKTYNPVTPTTAFPVSFPIFDNGDVKLFRDDVELTGFTVTGNYFDGVCENATIHINPGIFGKIDVVGLRTPRRTDQYLNGRPLSIKDHNYSLNRLTIENQEARRDIDQFNHALADETAARKAADSALQSALNAEIENRSIADAALQTAINDERTQRETADDTEREARIAGDNALEGQISGILPAVTDAVNRVEAVKVEVETVAENATALVEAAAAGFTGSTDGIAYDYGWTKDPFTYFDRDYGRTLDPVS